VNGTACLTTCLAAYREARRAYAEGAHSSVLADAAADLATAVEIHLEQAAS
jgi:hypothetical protein